MTPSMERLRVWRDDPRVFVREVFGVVPDPWQDEVLAAFPKNPRVAMKAAKGCGKSTLLAWLCWNFLVTRPHPKVIATSITGDNLRDGLWSEMSKWQQKSPLLLAEFTWHAERIVHNRHPETWWMSARTWVKGADASQQANTLAGVHADYVLIVADEVGGIPDAVIAAAEGNLSTGIEVHLVIAGNPTHLEGPLYRACTLERALWWLIEITGDPNDPKRSSRISLQWALEQIQKYGRDNPWVIVNVFGRFPPGQSNALFDLERVTAASKRSLMGAQWMGEHIVLGVDVARFGDDRTVCFMRQGPAALKPAVWRGLDTMQVAARVGEIALKHKPVAIFVDATGLGAGVVDRLKQLGHNVIGVESFGSAMPTRADEPAMLNKRVECWWKMREWLVAGGCIPDDAELISELTAPTYWYDAQNRVQLEGKKDLKERGLPSPDKADALSLTFAFPVAFKGMVEAQTLAKSNTTVHEYDPLNPR